MNQPGRTRTALATALATALVITGLGIAACGGDDDSETDDAPTTHTLADVRACFEDEGQKIREIEVSFAKVPPDIDVSSKAGSADIWVRSDGAAATEVVEQHEGLSDLGDPSLPESDIVVSGNAVATISSTSSPDYRAVVESCLPPS